MEPFIIAMPLIIMVLMFVCLNMTFLAQDDYMNMTNHNEQSLKTLRKVRKCFLILLIIDGLAALIAALFFTA